MQKEQAVYQMQCLDDSIKVVKNTKSVKKLREKVSKQQESRLGEDAPDHNKNEEAVPERLLRIRK